MKLHPVRLLTLFAAIGLVACGEAARFDLGQKSDNFEQNITYNNKVDIVWMIDSSSSMAQHQSRLSDQVPSLIEKLNSLKMDYRMVVVTSSLGGSAAQDTGGKFVGTPKVLSSTTPDLVNIFKSRLIVGENGSNMEQGLRSIEMALSPSYLANEGRDFFRDDALLVVIALSDEDDKSKSDSAAAAAYYKTYFDGLKKPWVDGTKSWVFNFIGVLTINNPLCTTYSTYSEAGFAFMNLADYSGGVKESICSTNLTTAVGNIRSRILQILTDFKLSSTPDLATLTVKINGVLIPRSTTNGWDYLSSTNSIRFYGSAVPAADASIKVDFKPTEAN